MFSLKAFFSTSPDKISMFRSKCFAFADHELHKNDSVQLN